MRPSLLRLAVLALPILGAPLPARAAYHALEEIPVESRTIRDVEDLAATYGLGWAFHSTRPWDRADLRSFLNEVLVLAPGAESDPAAIRLRRELSPEAGGWEPLVHAREEQRSLEVSPYLRADYAEDRARHAFARDFRGGLQGSAMLGEHALVFTDVYAD